MAKYFPCLTCGTPTKGTTWQDGTFWQLCLECYVKGFDETKYDDDPETDEEGD
jgi:hypothetical protein